MSNIPSWYKHVSDSNLTPELKDQLLRENFEHDQKLIFEPWRINPAIGDIVYCIGFNIERRPVYNGPLFTDPYPFNTWLNEEDAERAVLAIESTYLPVLTKEFYALRGQLELFGDTYKPHKAEIIDLAATEKELTKVYRDIKSKRGNQNGKLKSNIGDMP